jgi:uncharacterized membrane protein
MLHFIKTTILGGLLFLVPVVILIFIIKKAHESVSIITGPVLANLPVGTIAGIAIVDLLTIAVVLLICFLAGLWAKCVFPRGCGHSALEIVHSVRRRKADVATVSDSQGEPNERA